VIAGCTGFIYALDVANAMIASSNANYALVVGSESLSRLVDWNDRSTAVLFGDGAGAAIVAKSNETHRGCISFILGAEGSGAKDLYLVQPERSRTFERPAPIVPYIYMNGKKVYDFAVRSITMLIERCYNRLLHLLMICMDCTSSSECANSTSRCKATFDPSRKILHRY